MIVYLVRSSDTSAHEGEDGVVGVFFSKESAEKNCIEFLSETKNSRYTHNYDYYVEEWLVN